MVGDYSARNLGSNQNMGTQRVGAWVGDQTVRVWVLPDQETGKPVSLQRATSRMARLAKSL